MYSDISALRVATRYLAAREWGDPAQMISEYRRALTAFQTSITALQGSLPQFSRFSLTPKQISTTLRGPLSRTLVPLVNAGRPLSNWVVQTRVIPPGKAKAVEMAARAFNISRVPQDIVEWNQKNSARLTLLLEAASWPERSAAGGSAAAQVERVGPFTVHNTIDADAKHFKEVKGLIENASRALSTTRDFKKVLYGDVFVVGQLRQSTTLAWYNINHDEVFVRSLAKKGGDDLQSLIHELGHRYWFKFATSDQKRAVHRLFLELSAAPAPKVKRPTVGDELPVPVKGAKGTKFIIVRDTGDMYETEPKGRFPVQGVLKLMALAAKGETVFPSRYSMTSGEEFFAECFAFYTMGRMKSDLAKKFEAALK